jgi:hypothetical protein
MGIEENLKELIEETLRENKIYADVNFIKDDKDIINGIVILDIK